MARAAQLVGPAPKIQLSVEQMRSGVGRLTKRLEELQAFDAANMQDRSPPELVALSAGIRSSLAKIYGEDTAEYRRFSGAGDLHWSPGFYLGGSAPTPISEFQEGVGRNVERARTLIAEAIKGLGEDIEDADAQAKPAGSAMSASKPERSNKIFIVHGHDEAAKQGLARFLEKLDLEAIILQEQPDEGRTIIEKFETHAGRVGFAIVLLTPDDLGAAKAAVAHSGRARQNVMFELGYFAAKLGRGRTCLLRKGDVEIPSDLYGVIYTELDAGDGWKMKLVKEMKAAGLIFDANKAWE